MTTYAVPRNRDGKELIWVETAYSGDIALKPNVPFRYWWPDDIEDDEFNVIIEVVKSDDTIPGLYMVSSIDFNFYTGMQLGLEPPSCPHCDHKLACVQLNALEVYKFSAGEYDYGDSGQSERCPYCGGRLDDKFPDGISDYKAPYAGKFNVEHLRGDDDGSHDD